MKPTVRCKFICQTIEKSLDSDKQALYRYVFFAVYSGSEENQLFWKYTPVGKLEVQSVRNELFEIGKEYYLDLTLAEAPETAVSVSPQPAQPPQ